MCTLNRTRYFATCMIAASVVAGCALTPSPTPYQPASDLHGYTDEALAEDLFRVGFRGNAGTSQQDVEDSLFRRMVEIAETEKAGSFSIVGRETTCTTTLRTTPETTCIYHQSADTTFPYYFGIYELESPWHSSPRREYEAVATIRLSSETDCGDYRDCFVTSEARASIGSVSE